MQQIAMIPRPEELMKKEIIMTASDLLKISLAIITARNELRKNNHSNDQDMNKASAMLNETITIIEEAIFDGERKTI